LFFIFVFPLLQDFQKDIIRATEALALINNKHIEVGKNLLHVAPYDFSHGDFAGNWFFGWHEKFFPVSDDILCQ